MWWTHCSFHLGLKQCQKMVCGKQALEWESGCLCSITTSKYFPWPWFPPPPSRRVILNIDKGTTSLYSDRWKISSRTQFKVGGWEKDTLYFHSSRSHWAFVRFLLQCLENPTCPPLLHPKDISSDPMETAPLKLFCLQPSCSVIFLSATGHHKCHQPF